MAFDLPDADLQPCLCGHASGFDVDAIIEKENPKRNISIKTNVTFIIIIIIIIIIIVHNLV